MEESSAFDAFIANDAILPSQWCDAHRAGGDPIKNLMFAILELSLRDATGVASPMSGRKRRKKYKSTAFQRERAAMKQSGRASALRRDARAWIFGDADGPFNFRTCCETLEIDGEKLRERIRGRSAEKRPPLRAAHRLRAAVIRPAWRAGPDAGLTLIRTS